MPSSGLIVFAPIKAGNESRLRDALNPIGNDINPLSAELITTALELPRRALSK